MEAIKMEPQFDEDSIEDVGLEEEEVVIKPETQFDDNSDDDRINSKKRDYARMSSLDVIINGRSLHDSGNEDLAQQKEIHELTRKRTGLKNGLVNITSTQSESELSSPTSSGEKKRPTRAAAKLAESDIAAILDHEGPSNKSNAKPKKSPTKTKTKQETPKIIKPPSKKKKKKFVRKIICEGHHYICTVCNKRVVRISKHLILTHKKDPLAQMISKCKERSDERLTLLTKFRMECMYKHCKVMTESDRANSDYYACNYCSGFYVKVLPTSTPYDPGRDVECERDEKDELEEIVQSDSTLKFLKVKMLEEGELDEASRQRLRLMALVLNWMRRKDSTVTNLESIFHVSKCTNLKKLIRYLQNKRKIDPKQYDIKAICTKAVEMLILHNLQFGLDDSDRQQKLYQFLGMFVGERVTIMFEKPEMPSIEDIHKLQFYLNNKLEKNYSYLSQHDIESDEWFDFLKCILLMLITFNPKSALEVTRLNLSDFNLIHKRKPDATCTRLEKILINYLHSINTLILTPIHINHIQFIVKKIKEKTDDDLYIFFAKNTFMSFEDVLEEFSKSCSACNPNLLMTEFLNEEVAAIGQLFQLDDSAMRKFAYFFGRPIAPMLELFEEPEDVEQIVRLSKFFTFVSDEILTTFRGEDFLDLFVKDTLVKSEAEEDSLDEDDHLISDSDPSTEDDDEFLRDADEDAWSDEINFKKADVKQEFVDCE